ncbi:MAG: HindIII family type II restriction endonuclease [Armatimonadetes bacterium]|nr:HindIII family type II restriction endonuclease [Armatimonadota bacterium]
MQYNQITDLIVKLSENPGLPFSERALVLQNALEQCSDMEIVTHLENAGIIPECFSHDSTEEKLFAKYCDSLLAIALNLLGMKASIIIERADSADVIASFRNYSIVGDAKAFRLSRTAKNQKDFKVDALNRWRKGANYACLIAPLYQYPKSNSQIYQQAIQNNVTLLSYAHLSYLIRHKPEPESLEGLWRIGTMLTPSSQARTYWDAIGSLLSSITITQRAEWDKLIQDTYNRLPIQAEEQVLYLNREKERIQMLSHTEAVLKLIAAYKIDRKIADIRRGATLLNETKEIVDS